LFRLTEGQVEKRKWKSSESYSQNGSGLYTRYQVISTHTVLDRIGKAQHMHDNCTNPQTTLEFVEDN